MIRSELKWSAVICHVVKLMAKMWQIVVKRQVAVKLLARMWHVVEITAGSWLVILMLLVNFTRKIWQVVAKILA